MAKKISFPSWTKAEHLERQDGHSKWAHLSCLSLGTQCLGVHRFPVSVKAIQILICFINLSTQNIERCRKASKVFNVFNASGEFY